jgi:hypothetical protein
VRRLFISDSEKPRNLPKLFLTVLLVGVVIGVCDQLGNVLLQRISRQMPSIMRGAQNVVGVEALWQMQDAGISPIVFTGSSQMQTAVVPSVFDDEMHKLTNQAMNSVNVSFTGAGPEISYQVIKNLFAPAGVKTVIYGIEMRALHKQSGNFVGGFRAAPLGYGLFLPPGIQQSIAIWLARHSALVRYRSLLQTWLVSGQVEQSPFSEQDRGYLPLSQPTSGERGLVLSQFVPFETSREARDGFAALAEFCHEAGLRCIVANMPMHERAYRFIPMPDDQQYRDLLLSLVTAAKLPLWDFNTSACRSYLGDDAYFDLNHLNSTGAPRFTRMLATVYAQQNAGIALPPDSAAYCVRIIRPS